ncbi:hypothetical protein [Sphingomonas sp.]|uniref:hypothetical protein n=1 Tax=Sphingomonas sp. TaxID=28214 RepID=UPI0039C8E2AF
MAAIAASACALPVSTIAYTRASAPVRAEVKILTAGTGPCVRAAAASADPAMASAASRATASRPAASNAIATAPSRARYCSSAIPRQSALTFSATARGERDHGVRPRPERAAATDRKSASAMMAGGGWEGSTRPF